MTTSVKSAGVVIGRSPAPWLAVWGKKEMHIFSLQLLYI